MHGEGSSAGPAQTYPGALAEQQMPEERLNAPRLENASQATSLLMATSPSAPGPAPNRTLVPEERSRLL